jgi:hypothetical protein
MAPSKPSAADAKEGKAPRKRTAKPVKKSPTEAWLEQDAAAAGPKKVPSDEEDTVDVDDVTEMLTDTVEGKPAATSKSSVARGPTKKRKKKAIFHVEDWNNMMFEALVYRAEHGDLNAGAKDEDHENLFGWMQEQRKQFKLYQDDPSSSTLTQDQVNVLDSLHFHWHTRGEEHWNRMYLSLKQFQEENGHCLVSRSKGKDKLGDFVTDQRRQYKLLMEGKPSRMTHSRKALLDELGFVWQLRQRTGWDDRYNELVQFKEQYGDTMVPQLYSANKALGKWVAKQREQHRLLHAGKHSFLTPDRLQQLNEIGFVWHVQGPGRPGRHTSLAMGEPAASGLSAVPPPAAEAEAPKAEEPPERVLVSVPAVEAEAPKAETPKAEAPKAEESEAAV